MIISSLVNIQRITRGIEVIEVALCPADAVSIIFLKINLAKQKM